MSDDPGDITSLLRRAARGDSAAEAQALERLHVELRRLAARHLRRERTGHTLQPTALVHEAYLRLLRGPSAQWNDRGHFFALASRAMRRILVDHARRRGALKRGVRDSRERLDESLLVFNHEPDRIVAVDESLQLLEKIQPRQARIVELRFFAGLTEEEIAGVLNVSARTVKRDWVQAKQWLYARLK